MVKSKKRLHFVGAQGTGKTTILNHYKEQGYNVITEIVRNLAKEGVNINEMGDVDGQKKIFSSYQKLLKSKKGYISDRGLVDVLSYTFSHAIAEIGEGVEEGPLKKLADKQYLAASKFYQENPDIQVCYFPIEFDVVDDGVRSTDENFRSQVDFLIKSILDSANIKYHTITGTVEERIGKVDAILNS